MPKLRVIAGLTRNPLIMADFFWGSRVKRGMTSDLEYQNKR